MLDVLDIVDSKIKAACEQICRDKLKFQRLDKRRVTVFVSYAMKILEVSYDLLVLLFNSRSLVSNVFVANRWSFDLVLRIFLCSHFDNPLGDSWPITVEARFFITLVSDAGQRNSRRRLLHCRLSISLTKSTAKKDGLATDILQAIYIYQHT